MNAHIIMKVYSNGASYPTRVMSSKKRAQAYIDKIVQAAREDGWVIMEDNDNYLYGRTVKIIPENAPEHSEMFYIDSHVVE